MFFKRFFTLMDYLASFLFADDLRIPIREAIEERVATGSSTYSSIERSCRLKQRS